MKKSLLVAFGNFLLSPERKEAFANRESSENDLPLEERLSMVHDADIENFFANQDHSGLMTFGDAVEAAKGGAKISRQGWNGKGMFLYYVPANSYPAVTEVAKAHFGENNPVPYGAYIAMKTAQENVVPWLASQTDVLAEDWVIVE